MDIAIKTLDPNNELKIGYKWAGQNGSTFLIPLANNPTLTAIQTYLRSVLPATTEFVDPESFHCTLLYMPNGDTFQPSSDLLTHLVSFGLRSNWMTTFDTPDGTAIVIGLDSDRPLNYLQSALFYQALYEGVEISPFSWNSRYTPHITMGYIPKTERMEYFDGFMPMPFAASVVGFAYSNSDCEITDYLIGQPPEPDEEESESEMDETLEEILEEIYDEIGIEKSVKPSLFQRLKAWLKPAPTFDTPTGFKIVGDNRWIAWYTNGYQDRDKEWCATKAIEADIAYMWETKQFPELWYAHIGDINKAWNPTKHGQADWVGMIGRFAVATGTFDDTPFAQKMKAYYQKHAKEHGVSHGFHYDPAQKIEGVYNSFHTFEISPLPADKASNVFTPFAIIKGVDTMATQEQEQLLAKAIGEQEAKALIATAENATKELDAQVAFKAAAMSDDEDAPLDEKKKPAKGEDSDTKKQLDDLAAQVQGLTAVVKMVADTLQTQQKLAEEQKALAPKSAATPIMLDERKQQMIAEMNLNREKTVDTRTNDAGSNLMSGLLATQKSK